MSSLGLALTLALAGPQGLRVEQKSTFRHPSAVVSVVAHPDSTTAWAALDDGRILTIDLRGKRVTDERRRFTDPITSMAIDATGNFLAVSTRHELAVLDTKSLKPVERVRPKHRVTSVCFDNGGRALFAAQADGSLNRYRLPGLAPSHRTVPSSESLAFGLTAAPDGRTIATGDRDGTIHVWNTSDLSRVAKLRAHAGAVSAIAYSADGKHLASGGADNAVNVWSVPGYEKVAGSSGHHEQHVRALAFARDGRLFSAGYDGLTQVWSAGDFAAERSWPKYRGFVHSHTVTPDGKWLIRGGSMLDLVPLSAPLREVRLRELGGAITCAAGTPDGSLIATANLDRTVIVWDVRDPRAARELRFEDWTTAVAFDPQGTNLAVGLANGRIEVFQVKSLYRVAQWRAHDGEVTGLSIRGPELLSAGTDDRVARWRWNRRARTKRPIRQLSASAARIVETNDWVAVGGIDGATRVFDRELKTELARIPGRPFSVTALAATDNGQRLGIGYFDGTIAIVSSETWKQTDELVGRGESVLALAFGPMGTTIAAGLRDGQVHVFDAWLRWVAGFAPGRRRECTGLVFSAFDHRFFAAGADQALRELELSKSPRLAPHPTAIR